MKYVINTTLVKFALFLGLGTFLSACDDGTGELGTDIMPHDDKISIYQDAFYVKTNSLKVDSVLANTKECYLGRILDPETKAITSCDYLAQFHVMESYQLPNKDKMVKDNKGNITADSVDIRIYFSTYYGDSLNVMKIGLYELDKNNILEENKPLYSNLNPSEYINNDEGSLKVTTSFAVHDLTLSDTIRTLSSFYKNIRIRLPKEYGDFLLNSYYDNSTNFTDSYHFIHNICPGFYIKLIGGLGTMINVDVSTLNVYFSYHYTTSEGKDSITAGIARMAATEEVIQNTHVENQNIDQLLASTDYTFIKSPSGIFTEVTLPIDSAYKGDHYFQRINSAQLFFSRYNNKNLSFYNLKAPGTLLMIRKSELYSFFEENKIPDGITSYVSNYNISSNGYAFTNINNMFESIKEERDEEAGVTAADDETTRSKKYEEWEKSNPEWNKVVLLPITADYNSSNVIVRVKNDLSLNSTRLVSGNNNENTVKVALIYSKFQN